MTTKEKKNTYDEMVERINQQFTNGLEEKGLKWFKEWSIQPNSVNGKTNTHYHGVNDNHKAYINSWLESLKGDKKYFVNAFKEAEKASAYIIDLYEKECGSVQQIALF